ncbi:MAG: hypothetical protein JWO63_3373, partial [Frankiales bacterium]|nr:hypothetical protein [Frankiales bacterium]
ARGDAPSGNPFGVAPTKPVLKVVSTRFEAVPTQRAAEAAPRAGQSTPEDER